MGRKRKRHNSSKFTTVHAMGLVLVFALLGPVALGGIILIAFIGALFRHD